MKHSNIKKNVINSKSLSFREIFNAKYQLNNFDDWIGKKYSFKKSMEILDLGCGNGKQIIQAHKKLKNTGRITGIDLSKKSIQKLMSFKKKNKVKNLILINGSMDDIQKFFKKKVYGYFDLIHSTYAFYYSKNFNKIMNFLKSKLHKNGRFIITFPGGTNSLKNDYLDVKKSNKITLKYNVNSIKNNFKKNFKQVSVYRFTNKLLVTSYSDLIKFTQTSGFYDKSKENIFIKKTKDKFIKNKKYVIKKNSIMIVGKYVR